MAGHAEYQVTVPGPPKGRAQPWPLPVRTRDGRMVRKGVLPEATKQYYAAVRWAWAQTFPGFVPVAAPLLLRVEAYFPIPAGASARRRENMLAGRIRPTVAPDLSNIRKAVEDALKGVAFADDRYIVSEGGGGKWYAEVPGTVITMVVLPAQAAQEKARTRRPK